MKYTIIRKYSLLCLTATALSAGAVTVFAADRDDQIENTFKSSHIYRTQLKNTDLSVDSDGGVVTLSGKVETEDQKRLAEDTARGIPGVQRINNELRVTNQPKEMSDDWIATKVRGSLLFHRNVGITNTNVAVNDGVVTLSGTVENEAEKALAAEYAGDVKGVKRVQNNLQVGRVVDADDRSEARASSAGASGASVDASAPSASRASETGTVHYPPGVAGDRRTGSSSRTAGDRIDDASITAQLKYALSVRRSTSALRTDVNTNDGVVTIRGEAGNSAEKDLVTQLAQGIEGVREVRNEMSLTAN
jgi:osmotically-inducible protein OsmY